MKTEIKELLDEMREIAEDLYLGNVTTDEEDTDFEEWIDALERRLMFSGRVPSSAEGGR